VRCRRPQPETRVLLSHDIGRRPAARDDQETMATPRLGQAGAHLAQALAAAQAATDFDDRVDHGNVSR
jgi:hypothetical protein